MASTHATRRESRHTPFLAGEAVKKLTATFMLIRYRERVRPHEAKRIQDAFTLIAESSGEGVSKTIDRRNSYRWFLKKVRDEIGPQMVVLCAVGLGQSAVGGMRDRVQLEFLAEIKEREEALKSAVLQKLVDECSASGPVDSGLY